MVIPAVVMVASQWDAIVSPNSYRRRQGENSRSNVIGNRKKWVGTAGDPCVEWEPGCVSVHKSLCECAPMLTQQGVSDAGPASSG